MSAPVYFSISFEDENDSVEIWLGSAAVELYHYLEPLIAQHSDLAQFHDGFVVNWMIEDFTVFDFDNIAFNAVYHLIMQACDELDSLKPYRAKLKTLLEADPRFAN